LVLAATLAERAEAEQALRKAHDELESRVQHRTADLTDANQLLRVAITERELRQEALEEAEARFRAVVETAKDAVVQADQQGNIIGWNPSAQTIFGYAPEEVTGRPLTHLMPERYHAAHQQGLVRFRATGEPRVIGKTLELEGLHKDGNEFPIELSISHWRTGDEMFFGALIRDISRRKQAQDELMRSEKQLRALTGRLQSVREAERTRVARELHDELGHALTGLKMDVVAGRKQLTKAGDDPRPVLHEKLDAMSRLIDGMIKSVRRISSDLRPGLLDDFGLVAAIEWQANDFQNRSGIACELKSLPSEIALGRDATTAVFRIFQEALINVVRHAKASRVEVTVIEEDGQLLLEVADNGRGISEAELADKVSLGLLGMRERAAMLGGEVRITGTTGRGTTVQVRIPVSEGGARANPDR